mgnify:CR=1 FL=1
MIEYIDPRTIYKDAPKEALTDKERLVLRQLASKVYEYSQNPEQKKKRELWKHHNNLERIRPMILVFPEGAWLEILPWNSMVCRDNFYRAYEWELRRLCFRYEHFADDFVIEPYIEVPPVYEITPFLEGTSTFIHMDMEGRGKGKEVQKVLLKEEADIEKLRKPKFFYDKEATERNRRLIQEVIGDLIEVRLYGYLVPDTSLLRQFIEMRGADQIFYDLYDRPEWIHDVLTFMKDSTLELMDEMEKFLTAANTGNDYIGSGGIGYVEELKTCGKITYANCWGFADAQELVGVSPAMYEEFATMYHQPILERFGLNCYGCCEPMHDKLEGIKKRIKNLRRISVNPWTDREIAAASLGASCIYSWKPEPTVVTQPFSEEAVRKDIEKTMCIASDCVVEMILKDTMTVEKEPERISRWITAAKKIAEKGYS